MKSKKIRHLSTKPSGKKPTKSHQKWWLIIILAALFIGYLLWKNVLSEADTIPIESVASTTEQTEAVQSAPMSVDSAINDTDDNAAIESGDHSETAAIQTLNPSTILNAPLPNTDSLAKEEIDRLADERQRLAEQEKLAAEQVVMNKQLTEMKAEQIALLEEQIAQLEADAAAQSRVK